MAFFNVRPYDPLLRPHVNTILADMPWISLVLLGLKISVSLFLHTTEACKNLSCSPTRANPAYIKWVSGWFLIFFTFIIIKY